MGIWSPHQAAVARGHKDLLVDPPESRPQSGRMLPENRYSSNELGGREAVAPQHQGIRALPREFQSDGALEDKFAT